MQQEIRRKTKVYGTTAFLTAIALVALIYTFGAAPVIFNPIVSGIKTFSSYAELKNFLVANTQGNYYSVYSGGPLDAKSFGERNVPAPAMTAASGAGESYSTTNIQVAGVDEADIVKTDGAYVYVIANNTVTLLMPIRRMQKCWLR
jgi:uncharacterized secreted protein with C-terminal beta-propeller domain